MLLLQLTAITDWLSMSVALWLAAYLLIRAHRSRVTLRAVSILAALAVSFLIAYVGLYRSSFRLANAWAAALTLAIALWYDLTYQWLSPARRQAWRPLRWAILAIGVAKIIYLLVLPTDAGLASSSGLSTQTFQPTWISIGDAIYLLVAIGAAANNLRLERRGGARPHYRALWVASMLAVGASLYGMLSNAWPAIFPRIMQDVLLLASLMLLGYAIARYQAFVGRRTTLHDLPVSGLAVLGLAGLYGLIARHEGFSAEQVVFITAVAILSHAGYDMVREFLDRVLHQRESELRQELRDLAQAISAEGSLAEKLQQGLEGAATLLNASSAFVAQREVDYFVVKASVRSLATGTELTSVEMAGDDLREPSQALAGRITWLAPVHAGLEQTAVVGLGPRAGSTVYSAADLDLLVEIADWAGRMIEADHQQQQNRARLRAMTEELERSAALEAEGSNLLERLETTPDRNFVGLVEDALRHIADYNNLGGSGLATQLDIQGPTQIDRGKALRGRLIEAVETLRPAGPRPSGVVPREWHSYVILYDAYVEDVPNREIMARLYISEGTFNRLRRKALQAVGRAVWDRTQRPPSGHEGIATAAGRAALPR